MSERGPRSSPALIVCVVALVAALAGTAVAANPKANTAAKKVSKKQAKQIAKRQIDKRFPLGTKDIADAAVSQEKIAGAAVATGKIQDGAVNIAKLADNSVSSAKLRDGSVRSDALGPLQRRVHTIQLAVGQTDEAQAQCGSGERLISGGATVTGLPDGVVLIESGPGTARWTAVAHNGSSDSQDLTATAICLGEG